METSSLEAALQYAEAGYPVLLVHSLEGGRCSCGYANCETPGKHPMRAAWQKTATTDAGRIEAMFNRAPHAHVGIMPPKGCCIVDIDPRNGGTQTIKALLNGTKLPASTPIQTSGGGGLHVVFKGVAGKLGKGIDVKQHGRGFVVAWPAAHISGGKYSWRIPPWKAKPALLPDELEGAEPAAYDATNEPPTVPLERVQAALAHVNADDYERWINIGQALRHAYGDEGEEVWVEWSKTSNKFKEGDDGKWQSFDRNRDRALITVRSIISIARRNGYRPLATEFNGGLWVQGDISGYMDNVPQAIEWAFDGCIPCGKVTLMAGAGGSSKSFLTLTLALQLAAQLDTGPFKPAPAGKALLMVAEEDRQDVHRRVHTINQAHMYSAEQQASILANVGVVSVRGLDWRMLYHDDAGDLQETERVDYIIDEVRTIGNVKLIVFDPLVAFNGANENDNAEMSRLMFTFDRIANETGAAVLIVHHVSKGGQVTSLNDASQAVVRGASALVDNARSALLLTRMPRADAALYNIKADDAGRYVVVRFLKNNYGAHMPDCVFTVEKGGALRYAPEIQKAHTSMAVATRELEDATTSKRVAALVADRGGDMSVRDMAEAIGKSHTIVHRHIQKMLEEAHITRKGMGRNTEYFITASGRKFYDLGDDLIGG